MALKDVWYMRFRSIRQKENSQRQIIQPALQIGQPGDRYEREADAVADEVVKSPGTTPPALQRMSHGKEEEEGGMMQMKPLGESPFLQMKCAACEAKEEEGVQMKPTAIQRKEGGMTASSQITQQLSTRAGKGAALPDSVNQEMSSKIGADFSQVKVHTDSHAVQMSQDLGARAFTHGKDIYFNSGQYDPGSKAGRHLLAHELTHTVQQSGGIAPKMIQRQMVLEDPAVPFGAVQQNGDVMEQWLHELCPDVVWNVDRATGVVSTPDANFCANAPQGGHLHHSRSSTPYSCSCLCDYIGPGGRDVDVRITHQVNVGGHAIPLAGTGEGFTESPAMRGGGANYRVNISGQEPNNVPGAGDSAPVAGAGRGQTIRTPVYIVFGHELCGHVGSNHVLGDRNTHMMNPDYNGTSGVDAGNNIRREHSTQANNLGISLGRFTTNDGVHRRGAMYVVSPGETIAGIADRCGIAQAQRAATIFRENGDTLNQGGRTEHDIARGERLFIENVYWHRVIQGDTMGDIARAWGIPTASMVRANPQIANPGLIRVGQFLLVPNA